MSIFSKIFNRQNRKSFESFGLFFGSYPALSAVANASDAINLYETNPDVYACVREITTAVAGIELLVADADGTYLAKHPLKTLLDAPNPFTDRAGFIETLVSYLLITGAGYILRVPTDSNRPPKELYVLPSQSINVVGVAEDEKYYYNYVGGTATYTPDQLKVMRLLDPANSTNGLSPITAAATSARIGDMARGWNYNLLRQGARPQGAFKVKTPLSDRVRANIAEELEAKFSGYRNAGRPLVLEGEMDWINLGYSPAEMEYQANVRQSTLEVCRVFNIPPEMIGDSQNKTYSNYQEARKAFYHENILPLLDKISSVLTAWLSGYYGGVKVTYDVHSIEALQEDMTAVYDRTLRAVAQGVLTINEARTELGLEPIDDGDSILVGSNLLPLNLVSSSGEVSKNEPL